MISTLLLEQSFSCVSDQVEKGDRLVGSSAARLSDDTLELINLSLGTAEGTEPLLRELAGTLVLGVAEQLNDTALVGSKTGNLLDNVADEGGALAHLALGAGDARLDDASGGFVATVKTDGEPGAGGSFLGHLCDC